MFRKYNSKTHCWKLVCKDPWQYYKLGCQKKWRHKLSPYAKRIQEPFF